MSNICNLNQDKCELSKCNSFFSDPPKLVPKVDLKKGEVKMKVEKAKSRPVHMCSKPKGAQLCKVRRFDIISFTDGQGDETQLCSLSQPALHIPTGFQRHPSTALHHPLPLHPGTDIHRNVLQVQANVTYFVKVGATLSCFPLCSFKLSCVTNDEQNMNTSFIIILSFINAL